MSYTKWDLSGGVIYKAHTQTAIAFVHNHRSNEGNANAKLIAAAPDLLEALQLLLTNPSEDAKMIAQAAILKATL